MKNDNDGIQIDLYSVFRYLWKYGVMILMCACVVGVLSYVVIDRYFPGTYSVGINMAIVAKDNTTNLLNENSMRQAVERGLSVLNSEALESRAKTEMGVKELPGEFSASAVMDSNVIVLRASAPYAGDSMKMLKAVLDNYGEISTYLIGGYSLEPLGTASGRNIQKEGRGTEVYALLFALATVVAGAGVVILINLFDDKLHSEAQARERLDTDFLGNLYFEKKRRNQKGILINDPMVSISYLEAIEKVGNKIVNGLKRKEGKSLIVTSLLENEGKSTVTTNLALALAKRGKTVLLLEGDFRRPALSKLFEKDMTKDKEIIQYIRGEKSMNDFLTHDKETGIYYCFSKGDKEADDLLRGGNLRKIIQAAKECMDYVLIDTPPIGLFRDAEQFATMVDGALLIVRQDQAKAGRINDAIDRLDETGVNLLGFAFNHVRRRGRANNLSDGYERYGYNTKADAKG